MATKRIELKDSGIIFNEEELSKETVQNWMYSTLSLSTLLSEHKRLFDRILVEYIPSADRYLQLILEAMFRNRQLVMTYKRYEFDIAKTYNPIRLLPSGICQHSLEGSRVRMDITDDGVFHGTGLNAVPEQF